MEAWLAQRRSRSEVLRLIRQQWGVSERHADRYISEATNQWRVRVEPERGENRSRNLATCDVAIADSFRVGKLRDVAALLRLRATLDGSLATPATLVSVPPSDPTLDQNPADLVATCAVSAAYQTLSAHAFMFFSSGAYWLTRTAALGMPQ